MRRIMIAALLASVSLPAWALDQPVPGKDDPHIRQVAYNRLNRVNLVGQIGRQTTITFGQNEKIGPIVFGQDADKPDIWSGMDPKDGKLNNNLPLWPKKTDPTNMQVTTYLSDGTERVYQFALSAKESAPNGEDDPDAVFGLIFNYPEQAKQVAVAAWQARKVNADQTVARARLATDVFSGVRNWSYVGRPNKAWREAGWPKPEVSDNGMLTAFRFVGNVQEPAIYIVDQPECDDKGNERLAPFGNQDDLKIIKTTSQHFRLRLGDAVMEVCNKNWDPVGQNPGTGTTAPNVVREVVTSR